MALLNINSDIADQFVRAICNTLVHSLWQGLLLAAIAGLIVIFTKRASSALRYNLLVTALLLFAIGTLITFGVQFQTQHIAAATVANTAPVIAANVQTTYNHIEGSSLTSTLSGYLNSYHNAIVLIWFLIICAKSIQLGVGLRGVYLLKRNSIATVSVYWREKMQQLAASLNLKQTISILESGIAKVPMVIGHLKPVILIPIGLLTALSQDEVEAILVHELAHIKRRDYLVNMLQSMVEIVFFFNPAVLWISQLIKTERENCCDDLVLEQSSNKISYIRALVSCEEYQSAVPAYAMGFPGSKNTLVNRVKRLADNSNHSLNMFEKTFLAICLVVSGLCMSAFAERENIKRTVHEVVKIFQHDTLNNEQKQKLAQQTALLQKQSATARKNAKELSITTPQISDTIKFVAPLNIDISPLDNKAVKGPQKLASLAPLKSKLGFLDTTRVPVPPTPNYVVPKLDVNVSPKINATPAPKLDIKVSPKINVQPAPKLDVNVSPKINAQIPPKSINRVNVQPVYQQHYSIDTVKHTNKVLTPPTPPAYPPQKPTLPQGSDKNTVNEIANDLLKENLIKDKNNFSFKISNDQLIIDGVTQPEEIHRKIIEKYVKTPGDKVDLSYTYHKHN
jgi:bla regulator protein BlaR1